MYYGAGMNSAAGEVRAVRVPDELWHRARHIADLKGVTISDVIRTLLAQYVADPSNGAPVTNGEHAA